MQQIELGNADEYTLSKSLRDTLGVQFDGPGATTLDCLRTFYQDSVHQILTAETIFNHLKSRGIHRRDLTIERGVFSALEAVTQTYISGQRAKLIRRQMISRTAAGNTITRIVEAGFGQDIIITGAAGSGKSGCLLEIVEGLVGKEIPVLAFRLDRMQPVQTTTALGAEMGLPESPALVLARAFPGRKIALVVDQLDFVSTTSGRHPDFFDTLAALIGEVRGLRSDAEIHLILACRQFDFEHDCRLRALLPKDESPCALAALTEAEVRTVLTAEGGDATRLNSRQLQLLFLPQNLALFIESGLVRNDRATFVSQTELFEAYWHTKRTALAAAWPAEADDWMPIIETLVDAMNTTQEISVSKTRLDAFSPHFLDVMVSEGVLTFEGRRYGFGHESFFDYCFARIFASKQQELVDFLEADTQHLFRRAQTRQVLVYLRDDNRSRYLRNVSALLASGKIRSHLKLLILELIASFPDPGDDEWEILLPLIESEFSYLRRSDTNPGKIATRAYEIFRASRTLFLVADHLGYIERWLNSREPLFETEMVTYLKWQSRDHGDRVAELIEPFVGRGEEWKVRLRYMMEVHDLGKSRRYFDLFLHLLEDGTLDDAKDRFASNATFWSMLYGLGKECPEWYAEVAAQWLNRQVVNALVNREEGQPARIEMNDDAGIEELFESARAAPITFLTQLLPSILNAVNATSYSSKDEFPYDTIWHYRTTGEYISLDEAYLSSCEAAFEVLGQENPDSLRPFTELLRASKTRTGNSLLLRAYTEGGEPFAEEALTLLCEEPARLHCGYHDSSHWISRCLIKKLSPYCSAETFQLFETIISEYARNGNGTIIRGRASFTLLSALPNERLGVQTSELVENLKETFTDPDPAPCGGSSFTVVSPVTEEAAKSMSDDEWLLKIEELRGIEWPRKSESMGLGGQQEFAAMLQNFVKQEPDRFAKLALRFPQNIDSCYWMNVLYGLNDSSIASALIIEVTRKVFTLDDKGCLTPAADLLCKIKDEFLPLDAIEFLIYLATEHSDPDCELGLPEKQGQQGYFNGDIFTCGINTVRGRVAEQLRNLLITDKRYLNEFLTTIECLVDDPHISVRACAISTLFGVAFHDEELAVSLFHKTIKTDDNLLATHYAEDFVRRGLSGYFTQMRPHIERMLNSEYPKVRQVGGRLATLAKLTHKEADDLAETALHGDVALRLGVAEIAKHNITHPDCREWCEQTLFVLFNDTEITVLKKAANCFWHLWKRPDFQLSEYSNLISKFLKSAAFAADPGFLLHALEDSQMKLPEVVLDVCEHFVERHAADARDTRTHSARYEYTVGPLVFRAYQQLAFDPAQIRALNLIDRMCEEGLHSAAKDLVEFER